MKTFLVNLKKSLMMCEEVGEYSIFLTGWLKGLDDGTGPMMFLAGPG